MKDRNNDKNMEDTHLSRKTNDNNPGGNYKILEVLGESSRGTVYLALQGAPVRTKVTIKVIKPGINLQEIISTLETQRNLLTTLNHPYIAKIYNVRETRDKLPCFVMEYVAGLPLIEYCNQNNLGITERLTLFEKICQGIQHAHYKGIVHRNLRPSNIIVTKKNNEHIPKIVDFNLAKIIDTPSAFMSPEQAKSQEIETDTRTDIYALGALLYQLLTGKDPIEFPKHKEKKETDLRDNLKLIIDQLPLPPSKQLQSTEETDPLLKQGKDDLDWITMRALQKNREHRYSSAREMAEDINLFLNKKSLVTGHSDIVYKTKKFLIRNPVISVILGVILIFAISFSIWNLIAKENAEKEKDRAITQKNQADYNFALALKEKASDYAKSLQWQKAKLLLANSLLYHSKSQAVLLTGDIQLPFQMQYYILLNALTLYDVTPYFSHFNQHLATGDRDGVIRVWDISKGKEAYILKGNDEGILSVSFSQDGKYLAAGLQKAIKIWDITNKTLIHTLQWTEKQIHSILFSPDGKFLVSEYQGELNIWEIPKGFENLKEPQSLKLSQELKTNAPFNFSPDGKLLAFEGPNNTITLWNLSRQKKEAALEGFPDLITALSFSPDNKFLASVSLNNPIKIWDLSSKIVTHSFETEKIPISSLCFSSDGELLVSGTKSGRIKIRELSTGKVTSIMQAHNHPIVKLCFTKDGEHLISGTQDRNIRTWKVSQHKKRPGIIEKLQNSAFLGFSPNGKYLTILDMDVIKVWEFPEGENIANFKGLNGSLNSIICSPNGKFLAGASKNQKQIQLIGISGESKTKILKPNFGEVTSLCFCSESTYLASSSKDSIKIWEVQSGEEIITLKGYKEGISHIKFNPMGKNLFFGTFKGNIKIIDLGKLEITHTFKAHQNTITGITFSPEGGYIATTAAEEDTIKIWKQKNEKPKKILELIGHQDKISALTFSPGGKYLASGGKDNKIIIWDIPRGIQLTTLMGHDQGIAYLYFSPEGEFLTSVGSSNAMDIKIWDFHYYLNYLPLEFEPPYQENKIQELVKETEREIGFKLKGTAPYIPPTHHHYFYLGEDLVQRKQYYKAIDTLKNSLQLNSESAKTWSLLGIAYSQVNQHSNAINAYKKSLQIKKDSSKTLYQLGISLEHTKNHKEAIKAFNQSIQLKPANPKPYYHLGAIYRIQKNYKKSIEAFKQSKNINPKYHKAWFSLGDTYLEKNELQEAIDTYKQYLILMPEDQIAWNRLGVTYDKKEEYDKGIEVLKKATALNPHYYEAWNNIGIIYKHKKDYNNAIRHFKKVISINPKFESARIHLGHTYNIINDQNNAIESYKKAVEINPELGEAWANLGFIYFNKKNLDKAIEALNKTVTLKPKYFNAWNTLGDAYFRDEQFKNSIKAYERASNLHPEDNSVHDKIGKSYYNRKKYTKAITHFKKALRLNRIDFNAHFNLGLCYLVQKDFENSFNYYVKVIEEMKPDKSFINKAIEDVDELLKEKPDFTFVLLIRRYLYKQAGENSKSKDDLERFLKFIKNNKSTPQ